MRFPFDADNQMSGGLTPGKRSVVSVLTVATTEDLVSHLRRSLEGVGAVIERAPTVDAAEELRSRMHFDLIVVEREESDERVIQWIADIRRRGDRSPVILRAQDAQSDTLVAALRAGVNDVVRKGTGDGELSTAVKRLLWNRTPVPGDSDQTSHGDVFDADGIVGASGAMHTLCDVVRRVAPMPTTVLIQGESGTGKELVARAIHRLSGRTGNFAAINCGAISGELFESELFGHSKGAFTGALQARAGLISYAEGGTLFLDEIAEMPLPMQAKLLRVLEQRTVRPVGSNKEHPVNIRIVAATNHDLAMRVDQSSFREDLYHRLNVVALRVPSLRERSDDIPVLGQYFLESFSSRMGVPAPRVTGAEWLRLQQYTWPGNVRELRNIIERCVLLDRLPSRCMESEGVLTDDSAVAGDDLDDLTLETMERRHILAVLKMASGNKSEAARRLEISRKTLERKLRKWQSE